MGGEQTTGLYNKYTVKRNLDPKGKHPNCQYFVLDLTHDPFAKAAILAYAKACKLTHPALANDLIITAHDEDLFKGGRT